MCLWLFQLNTCMYTYLNCHRFMHLYAACMLSFSVTQFFQFKTASISAWVCGVIMQPFFYRGQLERNLMLRHTETHNYWTEGDPYTFWIFLIYSTCLFIYSALLIYSHVVLILYSVSVKLSPFLINLDVLLYLLEIYVFFISFQLSSSGV